MPTSVALPLSMPTFVTFKDGQFWAKASMPAYVTLPHLSKYIVVNDVQFLAKASMPTSAATAQNDIRP